ncbi:uncharacterized protein LOC118197623 [Stegodyphus dumicola]|uniref:uncharacterized protein LOC118197623 n=1 Tax=Stegodyphus dumicola TaxID=202533 RepID=UPI0015B32CFF|nr:uncharacterized protein LOC118197623 [Stegodyphus dumicola]
MMGAQKTFLKLLLCGLLASLVSSSAIKGKNVNSGSDNNRPFWTKTSPVSQELTDHSEGENHEGRIIAEQQAQNMDAHTGYLDDNRHSSVSLDQQKVKLENQPAEVSPDLQGNQQEAIVTNQEEYPSTGLLPADEITYTRDQSQQQFNPSSKDSSFGVRIHENSDFSSASCSVKGGCVQLTDESASKINYGSSDVSYSNEGNGNQAQDERFGQQQQFDTFSRSEEHSQEQIEISVPEKDNGFSSSFGSQHISNSFPGEDRIVSINKDKNEDKQSEFFRDEQTQTHTGNLDLAAPYDETGRQQEYVPPEQRSYQNTYPTSQSIDETNTNFNDRSNFPPRSEQFGDQNRNDGYNSPNSPPLFNGQSVIPDEENFNHQNGHDGQYHYLGNPIDWLKESVPGNPGVDYPIFYKVPETSFSCNQQQFEAGIYGDMDASCQVFHVCKANGGQDSFLCPNGTVFNQQYFVCDWWYNFNCADTPAFYNLNAQLYWDIDNFTPSSILAGSAGVDASSFGQVGTTNGGNIAYGDGQYFQDDITNNGQQNAFQKNQEDYSVISDQRRSNSEIGGNGQSQQTANDQISQHDELSYDTQSALDSQKPFEDTSFSGLEGNYAQVQINEQIDNPAAQLRPIDAVTTNDKNLDNSIPSQTQITDISSENVQEINIPSTGSDLRRGTASANNDESRLNGNGYVQQFINDENYFQLNPEIGRKDGESINTNLPAKEVHETFQTTIQPSPEVQDAEYARRTIPNQENDLSPETVNKQPVENVIFPDQRGQYPEIEQSAFEKFGSIDRVSDNNGLNGSPLDSSRNTYPVQQQVKDISFSKGGESAKNIKEEITHFDSSGNINPKHEAGESSFQQQQERVIFPSEFSQENIDSTKPSRSGGPVVASFDNRDLTGIDNNPVQHFPQKSIDDVYTVRSVQQAPEQVQTNSDEVRKEIVVNTDKIFRGSASKENGETPNFYEQQRFVEIPDISPPTVANHNALEDFQKRNVAFMATGDITLTPHTSSSTAAPEGLAVDNSKLIQQNIDETSRTQIANEVKNADSFTENGNIEPQTQNFRVEDIHSMVRGPQRIRQTEQQGNRDSINQRFIFKPNQRQISNIDANSFGSNTQELIQTDEIQQTKLPQGYENQQIHHQQQNIPSQRNRFVPHVNEDEDSGRNHGTFINRPEVKGTASNQPLVTPVNSVNWWNQMPQRGPGSSHSRPSVQRQKSNFEFQQRDISYDERAPVQVFQESFSNSGLPQRNFDLPQQVRLQNRQQNAFGSESRDFRPQSQEISRQPQLSPYPLREQYGTDDQTHNQNSEPHSQSKFHVTSGVQNFQENSRNIKSLNALSAQNNGPGYSQAVPSSSEITQSYNGWKPIVRQ